MTTKISWEKNVRNADPGKIFLVCVLAIVFIGLSIDFLSRPTQKSHQVTPEQYQEAEEKHNNATENRTQSNNLEANLSAPVHESGGGGNQTPLQKVNHDRRNANAQEGIWRAANLTAVLTIFQMIFGGVTIFLIYETLSATRQGAKAADDTARSAIVADRAYVTIDFQPDIELYTNKVAPNAKIVNHGKSVALDLHFAVVFHNREKSIGDESSFREIDYVENSDRPLNLNLIASINPSTGNFVRATVIGDSVLAAGAHDALVELESASARKIFRGERGPIFSLISYRDVFGNRYKSRSVHDIRPSIDIAASGENQNNAYERKLAETNSEEEAVQARNDKSLLVPSNTGADIETRWVESWDYDLEKWVAGRYLD